MIVAAISSMSALLRRCFFFNPISIIARLAILEVKRSSTVLTGIRGKILLKVYYYFFYQRRSVSIGIIQIFWFTDYDQLHFFFAKIVFQKWDELFRFDRRESCSNNFQWIGYCKTRSFESIIYSKYARQWMIEN